MTWYNLKEMILKEMILTPKEKYIQELIDLNIWCEERIRKRWHELENIENKCDVCGADFNKGEECNSMLHYTNR